LQGERNSHRPPADRRLQCLAANRKAIVAHSQIRHENNAPVPLANSHSGLPQASRHWETLPASFDNKKHQERP